MKQEEKTGPKFWQKTAAKATIAVSTFFAGTGLAPTPAPNTQLTAANASWVQRNTSDLDNIFAGKTFKNQDGKTVKPEEAFAAGPVVFIFGFNDCAMCGTKSDDERNKTSSLGGIADTVASMQAHFLKEGKNIQIVLVDVMPSADYGPPNGTKSLTAEEHLKEYEKRGVKMKGENGERLFHIIYPPSDKVAEEIQSNPCGQGGMGLPQNTEDPAQHSSFIVLFNNGKQHKFPDKINPKLENPGIRGHSSAAKSQDQRAVYGTKIAEEILKAAVDIPKPNQRNK